jgi:hypothetical protein
MKKSYVDEVSQIPLEDDEEMDSSNNILATNTKSKP